MSSPRSFSHRPIHNDIVRMVRGDQREVSHLLEKAERRLLCLVDLFPDSLGSDRAVTSLSLGSDLTEFGDVLGDLFLLRGIELILELVHSYEPDKYYGLRRTEDSYLSQCQHKPTRPCSTPQ